MSTQPKKVKINTLPSQIWLKIDRLRDYVLKMRFSLSFLKYVKRVKSYGRVKIWVKVEPQCCLKGHISKTIQPRNFILKGLSKYAFAFSSDTSSPMIGVSQSF